MILEKISENQLEIPLGHMVTKIPLGLMVTKIPRGYMVTVVEGNGQRTGKQKVGLGNECESLRYLRWKLYNSFL